MNPENKQENNGMSAGLIVFLQKLGGAEFIKSTGDFDSCQIRHNGAPTVPVGVLPSDM